MFKYQDSINSCMKKKLKGVFKPVWEKLKRTCKKVEKFIGFYITPNKKLSARQRLKKLRFETILSYILLLAIILLFLESAFIYYSIHHSTHAEHAYYPQTGATSLSCYTDYRDTKICCADKPYLTTEIIDDSHLPFETYECYKYKAID